MSDADKTSRAADIAQTATEGVLYRMRADILCLRLSPGEIVSERSLEEIYNASRTPIREALMRLSMSSLVVRLPKGYMIAPFDLAEIDEIFDFRELVEAEATRRAVQRATEKDLDLIRSEIEAGFQHFSPDNWMEMGLDFHVRVSELSGNRCIVGAMRDLTTRTMRARWLAVQSEAGRDQTHREHTAILDMIRARDTEAAVAATLDHAREVRRQVHAAIEAARPILGNRSILDIPEGEHRLRVVGED